MGKQPETTPDSVVTNVKRFGAVGDNTHDDTPHIQAAFNESLGANSICASTRRSVFFPPGIYKTTAPLDLSAAQAGGTIFASQGSVQLNANFNGFIFDTPHYASYLSDGIIEGIFFVNPSGGCIRFNSNTNFNIRNCLFNGHHGVHFGGDTDINKNAWDCCVSHCSFRGVSRAAGDWDAGGIGLGLGANSRAFSNVFFLWDRAIATYGSHIAVLATRCEVNNHGVIIGQRLDNATNYGGSAVLLQNMSMESNDYDFYCMSSIGTALRDCVVQGTQSSGHNSQAAFTNWGGQGIVLDNFKASGEFDKGGIWLRGMVDPNTPTLTLRDVHVPSIRVEPGVTLQACEQYHSTGVPVFTCTYANRPTYACVGTQRWFSDCDAVLGTTPFGSAYAPGWNTAQFTLQPDGVWRLA